MSCLICLQVIQDYHTVENAAQKIRIATLCKLLAHNSKISHKSEFDDDTEMCDLCTNCYPLFRRMEEIKDQISLLEEEIGTTVGQIQATIFDTSSKLESYGDNKIIQIRAMLLRLSGWHF